MSRALPEVGHRVTLSRKLTQQDVDDFGRLSLDHNRLHFDPEFAATSFFGQPIAHGLLGMALVSGCLTELMGDGNAWLNATADFQHPMVVGDTIQATLTLTGLSRRGVATMNYEVTNQNQEILITGEVRSMRCSP